MLVFAMAGRRGRLSLDEGGFLHLGDVPATGFDTSGWRRLNLLHDWAIEGPFEPDENVSPGCRPRGVG